MRGWIKPFAIALVLGWPFYLVDLYAAAVLNR